MKHTIVIYRTSAGYFAWHSDPKVTLLFGSDVLPTDFTSDADPYEVEQAIRSNHPDRDVVLRWPVNELEEG